ncbi:DUF4190 domain-containing protein [Streptomyces sp. J2-1]|uniref:DUF4190 domain-containing protein n=1 Tax=Streptomyces corallincola TaxID=2851888 RepID=UPI001C382416|nr:DUF4190 domain-containing protein [Streptomyces corallincola]MBV2357734.1 DUF4190 domain-containing protein [Streptomyces corallincola]
MSYDDSSSTSARPQRDGKAIASLCCGIVGLLLLRIVLGPLAIILGSVSRRQSATKGEASGMATAGIVLGVVDVVLWLLPLAFAITNGDSWYYGG